MIKNCILHFNTIVKHRWVVFKLCCRVGMPWRGFLHDLSKFSPTEFWEGVKYYQGSRSPILACREKEGYSKAWLHHRGRNKHHAAYWHDMYSKDASPIIPYKYVAEMICDKIAASITYNGKKWTEVLPMEHWNHRSDTEILNPKINAVLTETFQMVAVYGIKFLTKRNIKDIYNKHVNGVEDVREIISQG